MLSDDNGLETSWSQLSGAPPDILLHYACHGTLHEKGYKIGSGTVYGATATLILLPTLLSIMATAKLR